MVAGSCEHGNEPGDSMKTGTSRTAERSYQAGVCSLELVKTHLRIGNPVRRSSCSRKTSFSTSFHHLCISNHIFHTCNKILVKSEQHYARFMASISYINNSVKMYSLEHTDIPKVFFTPHPVGNCCTNVIRG
jgi:hypothetical protein